MDNQTERHIPRDRQTVREGRTFTEREKDRQTRRDRMNVCMRLRERERGECVCIFLKERI